MSRETSKITTFKCNSCGTSQVIGGDYPESVMDERGWTIDEEILGNQVDLCADCTAELKDFIRWEDPATSLEILGSKVIESDEIPCCCAGINPADGEEICEPCANNNHKGCVGPL